MTKISTNFINPNGSNIEEVKDVFSKAINLLIDYLALQKWMHQAKHAH